MDISERKRLCSRERNKLNKIFQPVLDPDVYKASEGLIENAAFLRASLLELQDEIRKNGYVESWDNGGGQKGMKDSCWLRAYNNSLKSYNTTIKQVLALVPKESRGEVDDGFDSF